MAESENDPERVSRRGFLSIAGSIGVGIAATSLGGSAQAANAVTPTGPSVPLVSGQIEPEAASVPFWGKHQAGIVTPAQKHIYFAVFDIAADKKSDVIQMMKTLTAASSRLTEGHPAEALSSDEAQPAPDSGEAYGLMPERLTITFGFGPGLFVGDGGKDRFGLAAHRPAALADLPKFRGEQLADGYTGGDFAIQACADDPQVAFHAVRQLARLAYGAMQIRWSQAGFLPGAKPGQTPRNLMGFKDGSQNVSPKAAPDLDKFVWAAPDEAAWMHGGSYLVARRIRIALEHWDRMSLGFQEQTFGRRKYSGAPIGGKSEMDPLNLDANDKDGNPVIAQNAHVRLANASTSGGAQILRRSYSYNDGVSLVAERWPPWHEGMEYDAGLLFLCYQRDPRTGFVQLFELMSQIDALNQFATHIGSGLFACPGGAAQGEYIGQRLLEIA